ncbi:unnamed protein product, partial [Vitrella brassicaformis CCMP3155]
EPDQSGGAPCPELSEERACNEDPCAVDCKVGGWGNFSECSKSCGGGSRTRNRTVEVEPSDDGEQCPDLEETEECNTQPCDPCAGLSCGLNEECRRSSDNTTATCKCTPPFTRASPEAECMNMQQQQQQQPAVGIPRPVSAESDQQQQGPVGIPSIPSGCNGNCRSMNWFNDTVCDMECFTEECSWDGDDCASEPRMNANQQTENETNRRDIPETCVGDCRDLEWVNDSVCDLTCYNYACGFDGGDCDPGVECTDLASYCKWNETCQSQDDGFGRCESLCSTIECSEDRNEVCEVQRIPEGEPGAGSGVGKCVCAENYVRGDNDECFQVRDCAVAEWKDWGECSKSCEGGVKKRTREVTAEPQGGGEECPELEETAPCNEQPCPVACVVGDWSIWSPCSKDCGGGKRRRVREITTEPQHDGEECPPLSEEEDCNTEPCKTDCTVSDWSEWDKCSEECGGGTQSRTRTVVEPDQSGGAPCPELSEERACNEDPCAVDCEVGSWGNFSECSKSCGGGTRTRNRTVEVEPSDDGDQCPDLEETEECNTQPCKTDCTVSDWSEWDKCSEECGGGTQSRTRTVVEPDQSGGAPCPELSEERACNEDPCGDGRLQGGWLGQLL